MLCSVKVKKLDVCKWRAFTESVTYGTAQMQLDACAYITRGFFTCCPHQPVRVPAYMHVKGQF